MLRLISSAGLDFDFGGWSGCILAERTKVREGRSGDRWADSERRE